jgi:hypothetical protein
VTARPATFADIVLTSVALLCSAAHRRSPVASDERDSRSRSWGGKRADDGGVRWVGDERALFRGLFPGVAGRRCPVSGGEEDLPLSFGRFGLFTVPLVAGRELFAVDDVSQRLPVALDRYLGACETAGATGATPMLADAARAKMILRRTLVLNISFASWARLGL